MSFEQVLFLQGEFIMIKVENGIERKKKYTLLG